MSSLQIHGPVSQLWNVSLRGSDRKKKKESGWRVPRGDALKHDPTTRVEQEAIRFVTLGSFEHPVYSLVFRRSKSYQKGLHTGCQGFIWVLEDPRKQRKRSREVLVGFVCSGPVRRRGLLLSSCASRGELGHPSLQPSHTPLGRSFCGDFVPRWFQCRYPSIGGLDWSFGIWKPRIIWALHGTK